MSPPKAVAGPAASRVVSRSPLTDLAQAATPSPVVNGKRFARFTFRSTTTKAVTITGSWGPSYTNVTSPMGGSGGVFTATIGPLTPGLYTYTFTVDGQATADPANPNVVHSSPTLTTFFVPGKAARFLTRQKVRHGALTDLVYRSSVTGTDRHAVVWTPPGYDSSKRRYPTLYLFHGGGGDYLDWIQQGRAHVILDNLHAQGKLKPMVVVMGDRNVDGALGAPQDDTFVPEVLDNLVPAVEQAFRVRTGAKSRALAGLSLGGLNAFNMLLTRPGAFRDIGDFSSGYFPDVITQIKSSDLLTPSRVKEINRRTHLFRIYIGNQTDIAYVNNAATRTMFDDAGVEYEFAGVYQPAGHVWKTWQRDLRDFAPRALR